MAGTLVFKIDDTLKKIVAHTRKHGKCRVAYSEPKEYAKPSLFLVKDSGVYLMSASDENLLREGGEKGAKCLVAYAEGLDPDKGDVWDESRHICGGDDFSENIDMELFENAIAHGYKKIKIKLSEDRMEVRATKR